jgi:hypothetical protein
VSQFNGMHGQTVAAAVMEVRYVLDSNVYCCRYRTIMYNRARTAMLAHVTL